MSSNHGPAVPTILFVSHSQKRCGVHQYGLNVHGAISKSKRYRVIYVECSSPSDLHGAVHEHQPAAILYNSVPRTLPWLTKEVTSLISVPQIGTIHEVYQSLADSIKPDMFDFYVAPDPTLAPGNPIVFPTGRPVPDYTNQFELPEVFTVGSFGTGGHWKDFGRVIVMVQNEFDTAVIRLHIPVADFVDVDLESKAEELRRMVYKSGIKLVLSHNFLSKRELLDFLARNTINVFCYQRCEYRGVSSVIDYALAVQRPIAVTKSEMFRHILKGNGFLEDYPVCVDHDNPPEPNRWERFSAWLKWWRYRLQGKTILPRHWCYPPAVSLRQIAANGVQPVDSFRTEWSEANLMMDYERVFDRVLGFLPCLAEVVPERVKLEMGDTSRGIAGVTRFNRILDNTARLLYEPVISSLSELCPDLMKKKIPEANVQQAFVLDTVQKFAGIPGSSRILCVGSFEDTAAEGLKRLGYPMDEVDPVLNTDFSTFYHRLAKKATYDIVFSTSVIEHVRNDELFVTQIVNLLAPGGVGILTFDYCDQYKFGDFIPSVDFRFYTQADLKRRILPLLNGCVLLDPPDWECPEPDFVLCGVFRYTFGTLVFKKLPSSPDGFH